MLEGDVPGRHRRGGWAQLAIARYGRHIDQHRHEHLTAVVRTLLDLVEAQAITRIALAATVDAVCRRAVHRLFLLAAFSSPGGACEGCDALQEVAGVCRLCGGPVRSVELGEAMVERVVEVGGTVTRLTAHAGLAAVGGVAARLQYPL